MKNLKHYAFLADLFRYPDAGFLEKVKTIQEKLEGVCPEAANEIKVFYCRLPQKDPDLLQSLFTRTFDIQAITTLDVAYVLFGDDYKRGEILANLNREHKKVKNDCGIELADHLPNLLGLLSKLEDAELLNDLVQVILAPALEKMIAEFDPARLKEKNKLYKKHYKTLIETVGCDNLVYQHALQALYLVVKKDFNLKEVKINDYADNDFLRSVGSEMDIEKVAKQ